MALKDVEPGRYSARVVDWGIETVEKLGGEPKAKVVFDLDNSGTWERISWDGFFSKRDGGVNQKTVDTLKVCGMKGDFTDLLEGGPGLDTTKELELTIIQDGNYLRVEWVNEPGGSQFIKKEGGQDLAKTLKGLSVKAGLKNAGQRKIKNHAPGADNGPEPAFDADEEIPF